MYIEIYAIYIGCAKGAYVFMCSQIKKSVRRAYMMIVPSVLIHCWCIWCMLE